MHAGGQPAVDWHAVGVLVDEIRVAVGLHVLGDALDGFMPADALPLVAAGFARTSGYFQSARAVYRVQQALRHWGTTEATADRVIRIRLRVDDFPHGVLGAVARNCTSAKPQPREIWCVAHFGGAAELLAALSRVASHAH